MGIIRTIGRLARVGLLVWIVTAIAVYLQAAWMRAAHLDGASVTAPVDAAIVLGAGIEQDGILDYPSRERVRVGVALLKRGLVARLILSGGQVTDLKISVAEKMREHALSLGAPANALVLEDRSASTLENLRFAAPMVRGRAAVITDDYHLTHT